MAGVGDVPVPGSVVEEIPDTYVGGFIDRLDHLQFKVLKPVVDDVRALTLVVEEQRKIVPAHTENHFLIMGFCIIICAESCKYYAITVGFVGIH